VAAKTVKDRHGVLKRSETANFSRKTCIMVLISYYIHVMWCVFIR